jgi:hypothetical protein
MATKAEIRNYATANGISNAEARAHFIEQAKINSAKSTPNFIQGKPFELQVTRTMGDTAVVKFDLLTEFKKMHNVVTSDIIGYNTRSNKIDFDAGDWGNDGGFFIAVLPCRPQGNSRGFYSFQNDAAKSQAILNQFKTIRLDDNWVMISAFCTSDLAWQHYNDVADNFAYAYIGYSTMRKLAPLSENRDLCIALSKRQKAKIKVAA